MPRGRCGQRLHHDGSAAVGPPPGRPSGLREKAGPRAGLLGFLRKGTLPLLLAGLGGACASTSSAGRVAPPFETSFEWAGLRFTVRVLPARPDRLRLRSEIRNLASGFRSARVPVCFPWIRAYREGRLAWEQWGGGACDGPETVVELPGGGEEVRHLTLSAREILGDSLPPGEYALAAYVPRANHPDAPPRAPMELPLGRVRLERSAPP